MVIAEVVTHLLVLLLFPPLLLGVIGRTKAWFAGRQGPPLFQPYRELSKLLQKGTVYSRTTTWIFQAAPVVSLAATLTAGLLVPLTSAHAPFAFAGDIVLFAYLLGLGRFFTVAAALDTGSSFEGMGASREAAFSALAEPVLFLALITLVLHTRSLSFTGGFQELTLQSWSIHGAALVLAALALFAVLLAENSRVPVDDPATHLELTMIHEVMVLDHGGPDLGLILYASAMKLFVLGAVALRLVIPIGSLTGPAAALALLAAEITLSALIGTVEASMARLRLPRVPQFIIAAGVLAATGIAVLLAGAER